MHVFCLNLIGVHLNTFILAIFNKTNINIISTIISTCCGMLDYMVVDTVVGGQLCINYIRENNIGRANFLVLEQTGQHRGGMERFLAVKVPEGAKRMIDLVTPSDPSLQLVFYMAVRDTLVSKDLESAVAIAYQGGKAMWRVVSTDGNLIDISGSMSGGGKSAKSGGMLLSGASTVRVNAADADQVRNPFPSCRMICSHTFCIHYYSS
jgi:structural maintenance of chromosome 4